MHLARPRGLVHLLALLNEMHRQPMVVQDHIKATIADATPKHGTEVKAVNEVCKSSEVIDRVPSLCLGANAPCKVHPTPSGS